MHLSAPACACMKHWSAGRGQSLHAVCALTCRCASHAGPGRGGCHLLLLLGPALLQLALLPSLLPLPRAAVPCNPGRRGCSAGIAGCSASTPPAASPGRGQQAHVAPAAHDLRGDGGQRGLQAPRAWPRSCAVGSVLLACLPPRAAGAAPPRCLLLGWLPVGPQSHGRSEHGHMPAVAGGLGGNGGERGPPGGLQPRRRHFLLQGGLCGSCRLGRVGCVDRLRRYRAAPGAAGCCSWR